MEFLFNCKKGIYQNNSKYSLLFGIKHQRGQTWSLHRHRESHKKLCRDHLQILFGQEGSIHFKPQNLGSTKAWLLQYNFSCVHLSCVLCVKHFEQIVNHYFCIAPTQTQVEICPLWFWFLLWEELGDQFIQLDFVDCVLGKVNLERVPQSHHFQLGELVLLEEEG